MSASQYWYQKRTIQCGLALILLQFFMIFGLILPGYEKIPYFEMKISMLKRQEMTLKMTQEHIAYFRKHAGTTETKLKEIKQEISKLAKSNTIADQLIQESLQLGLELDSHTFETPQHYADMSFQKINMILKGTYEQLMSFLKKVETINPYLVVTSCDLTNTMPLSQEPTLQLKLKLTVFLPEIS